MGEPAGTGADRWALRSVPESQARRYVAEGWWNDATLGATVAEGLAALGAETFRVHSKVRPWAGTFADVDRAARALAGALAGAGDRPGIGGRDPAAQLGGGRHRVLGRGLRRRRRDPDRPLLRAPRRWSTSSGRPSPDVVVTADRFGHNDYLAAYTDLLRHHPVPLWLVAADGRAGRALPRRRRRSSRCSARTRSTAPAAVDPDAPAIVGFTSGTTRDPKGVVHSHRTIGCEARQLDYMFPKGGPPGITGAPVGHFIGMLNAFLVPLLRQRPVHLVDVWDPGEVLRLMRDEGLGVGGGATYFLTSLLDHPDFTPRTWPRCPSRGSGGRRSRWR